MWLVLFLVISIGFIFWLYSEKKPIKKKDSTEKSKQEAPKGNEGVLDPEERVFGEVTYVRSVYEGEDE